MKGDLADIEIEVIKEDGGDGHWLVVLTSAPCRIADGVPGVWEACGSPSKEAFEGARHHANGLLARIALLAHAELEVERAIHGCGSPVVRAVARYDRTARILRRGTDYPTEREYVALDGDDHCGVTHREDGEVCFVIPKGRTKVWLGHIRGWIEQVQP